MEEKQPEPLTEAEIEGRVEPEVPPKAAKKPAKKRARQPKVDPERLDRLACAIRDADGGDFETFLGELRRIEKRIKLHEDFAGGCKVTMAGISAISNIGGTAGKWVVMTNWANAARRQLNKMT